MHPSSSDTPPIHLFLKDHFFPGRYEHGMLSRESIPTLFLIIASLQLMKWFVPSEHEEVELDSLPADNLAF